MDAAQTLYTPRRFDIVRGPQTIGAALVAIVTIVLGVRAVALWLTSLVPAIALASGIRTPVLPPRLGLPLADGFSTGSWLVETLSAIVFIAGYWYWTHYARRPVRTRGAAFRRAWAGVIWALVAAHIVRATLVSLRSGEGLVAYALMLGGGVLTAVIVGLVLGFLIGAVCAAVGPPVSTRSSDAADSPRGSEAGPPEAGSSKTGPPEAGSPETGPPETGSPTSSSPEIGENAASR